MRTQGASMKKEFTFEPKLHWVRVTCLTKYGYGDVVETLYWDGMLFDHRHRWGWYFRYRECLMQVKYPRYYVKMEWGDYVPSKGDEQDRIRLNKLAHRTRKITEIENNLAKARAHHTGMFPIEDDPLYKRTIVHLEKVKREREELLKPLHT